MKIGWTSLYPRLVSVAQPYVAAAPIWGSEASELINGAHALWNCAYFILRCTRDLARHQGIGRGSVPWKGVSSESQFTEFVSANPCAGLSVPIIGLSDNTQPGMFGSVHIAFLLQSMGAGVTGKLLPGYQGWIVLDHPGMDGIHTPGMHGLDSWFTTPSEAGAVKAWNPFVGDSRPADRFVYIVGGYLDWISPVYDMTITSPADRTFSQLIP
jgi:hypothetical protein